MMACGLWWAVAAAVSVTLAAAGPATLVRIDNDAFPYARCLDGTPGAFYFEAASTTRGQSRWVFSLEGGGECVDESSCKSRALGPLGSSKGYSNSTYLGQFQTDDQSQNPDFYDANKVFVKYCSGDLHSGNQTKPDASTWGLQFSGFQIVHAILATLTAKHDMHGALVVWSGDSAGGLGCFITIDYAHDMLVPLGATVVGAPIGGFYFNNDKPYNGTNPKPTSYIPWTFDALQQYHELWHAFVPTRCAQAYSAEPWTCLFAVHSYGTLASPVFVIEAQTDEVVMPLHNGLPAVWSSKSDPMCHNTVEGCAPDVVHFMESWSGQMKEALYGQIRAADGAFNPACLIHTSFSNKGPLMNGMNFLQAFSAWWFGKQSVHLFDTCGIMCNPSCNTTLLA